MIIMRGAGSPQDLITRGFGSIVQKLLGLVSQIFAWIATVGKVDKTNVFKFNGASNSSVVQTSILGGGSFQAISNLGGSEMFSSQVSTELILYGQLIEE